ncbi:class I SAM-dependent methyltransferase [Microvirga sp. BT688]|uniref:SAM-dependent methyltransferase n=1 Tax=Microvirga sp. TaxID=1873136 RepID=UPI001686709B|nr:class I SAM-dependent methyltransferase [Microvirga sp.]MBD2750530.1 class I SAM-dependent methyltransferase [Microvirga sp.]
MRDFSRLLQLQPGDRVIDLGGSASIWEHVKVPLVITIVNLPGAEISKTPVGPHQFTFLEGDATALEDLEDNSFDVAFSNSCIEHVGGLEKQSAFATEVRRLAPKYYVQTPSIIFPLEVHTGLPFWWFYPPALKRVIIQRWRKTIPAWCEMIEGTTVLTQRQIKKHFPDGDIVTERILGVPKSYATFRA